MSRILFVDDEPRVLEGIQNMLFEYVDEWDMAFVGSTRAALDACERAPFDVVVSDMRLPRLDGAALLSEVRERWPATVRIILSGQTDPAETARALPVVHDLLSKPVSAERLLGTIVRALALQRSCRSDALRQVAGQLEGLPPRPRTYERFLALTQDGAPAEAFAALVESDPAVVAGLLRVVNAAFFATTRPVDRVLDAIVRLGLEHTANVLLAICAYEALDSSASPSEATFVHCSTVAALARQMAPPPLRQRAFLVGLLHDVGYLVMSRHFPAIYRRLERLAGDRENHALHEQRLFGFDHGHCGAYLMRLWNLDEAVAEGIEHHHDPSQLPPERRALALIVFAIEAALSEERTRGDYDESRVLQRANDIVRDGGQ